MSDETKPEFTFEHGGSTSEGGFFQPVLDVGQMVWCPVHQFYEPINAHPWALACTSCGALVASGMEMTHQAEHQRQGTISDIRPWPQVEVQPSS